jgi:glucose/arabinose dehydrogenase
MGWRKHLRNILIILVVAIALGAWYLFTPNKAEVALAEVQGANPKLDLRAESFPSINIAEIVGWKDGEAPTPAKGLAVTKFAAGLDHPRWLYELPNGDVLVAESTQPKRETQGLSDWIARQIIKRANNSDTPANRITLLRDADGDGVAESRSVLLSGLNSPFGMALVGERLFVANTDSLVEFPYKTGDTKIAAAPKKLLDLPAGVPNNHWTRNIVASPDGKTLYIAIGSHGNIAEGGIEKEKDRAQIKDFNLATGEANTFAFGLRNPIGLAFNPISGTLWTTVNERDMLGPDGPPDYMTTVDFGAFYGWPYFYWGQNEDRRVEQTRRDLKQYSKRPDYALGPHVAALGLAFAKDDRLGANFANGAFVGLHGSWNRSPAAGYEVIYVPFNDRGFPVKDAKPVAVLSGFLTKDGDARGRPAGVIVDARGGLLVADDAGNTIWRVAKAG